MHGARGKIGVGRGFGGLYVHVCVCVCVMHYKQPSQGLIRQSVQAATHRVLVRVQRALHGQFSKSGSRFRWPM